MSTDSASKLSNLAQSAAFGGFVGFGAFGGFAHRILPGLPSKPAYSQIPNWVLQVALSTEISDPSLHENLQVFPSHRVLTVSEVEASLS